MEMPTAEIGIRLIVGLALILANGFFVAIEFALTRARQYPEEEFDERGLRRAWEMTQDLEIYLTSCQVGITASSIAVGIVAEPALSALFEPLFRNSALASVGTGSVLAFIIINLVHLTHGEQTPTYLGVERTKFVARYGAPPLYWFHFLISPLIAIGDNVAKWTLKLFGVEMSGAWLETEMESIESRAELRNRLSSVLEEGDLPEERQREVMNALALEDRQVREIMQPPEDIVALSTSDSVAENLERMETQPHSRYPLVGDELNDFRGVVYGPAVTIHRDDLESGEATFEDLSSPPMTLSPDTDINDAIDQFQAERQELALLIENGDVVGLVTITDALEEVIGEIRDPIDESFDID
jgi:CBS domain containing-hemolysin-like protein